MFIDRLKFGIEITFAGFLYLVPLILFSTGSHYHGHGAAQTKYLPYLALGVIALSYLAGVVADAFTHALFGLFLKKAKPAQNSEDAKLKEFLSNSPPELVSEFNYKRTQNLLLRVCGVALIFDSPSIMVWLLRRGEGIVVAVGALIGLICFGAIVIGLFIRAYKNYDSLRKIWFGIPDDIDKPSTTS
jgi:hypothetical protein